MSKDQTGIVELALVNIFLEVKGNTWATASVYQKGSVAPSGVLDIRIIFRDGRKGKFRSISAVPKPEKSLNDGLAFEVWGGVASPKHPPTVVSVIIDGCEVATLEFSIVSSGLNHHAISMDAVDR